MVEILSKPYYSYDDVLMIPQTGVVDRRADVTTGTYLVSDFRIPLQAPFVSAPMSSVTENGMARALSDLGAAALIHRDNTPEEQVSMFTFALATQRAPYSDRVGAAIGIRDGLRLALLYGAGCRLFCLDVAHADSAAVHNAIEDYNDVSYRNEFSLIVGNIATGSAARTLCELDVDAIKVGIGPGAACTTRTVTGFGVPQLTAVTDCSEVADEYGIPVIADGGIKNSGDAAKAIGAGATAVMLGSLLAGADESPSPGEYWGMASHKVNQHRAPEGVEGTVPRTGPVENTIKKLSWGLRSAVSYAGFSSVEGMRGNAKFAVAQHGSVIESGVRVA